jgi:hypothetical protein
METRAKALKVLTGVSWFILGLAWIFVVLIFLSWLMA